VTEATGQSLLAFARAKLFSPLGIATDPAAHPVFTPEHQPSFDRAGFAWAQDPQGYQIGGSFLKLTPRDLAKIGYLYLMEGLPGGRGSPIERRDRDCGQAGCSTRALRPARLAASTASPPASARTAASTPSDATTQPDGPPGSTGCAGTSVWWRQDSPTWLSVGGRRASLAMVGCSAVG
jgi:CubicO group peptidase (beta-lactamase class C family)